MGKMLLRLTTTFAKWVVLPVLTLGLIAYGLDWASLEYGIPAQRPKFNEYKVDQLYTVPNRWKEIEWSRGEPVMERCVNSVFPHYGNNPCWYVSQHLVRVNSL
jgi:hypothetical protein